MAQWFIKSFLKCVNCVFCYFYLEKGVTLYLNCQSSDQYLVPSFVKIYLEIILEKIFRIYYCILTILLLSHPGEVCGPLCEKTQITS